MAFFLDVATEQVVTAHGFSWEGYSQELIELYDSYSCAGPCVNDPVPEVISTGRI